MMTTRAVTEGLMFAPHARSLRVGWAEALHAARQAGDSALTLRIGLQNDLAANHIGDWVNAFLAAFPGVSFYVEPDYSANMCAEIAGGSLDLALLFTPQPNPDLHFETIGEIAYRMVSTEAAGSPRSRRRPLHPAELLSRLRADPCAPPPAPRPGAGGRAGRTRPWRGFFSGSAGRPMSSTRRRARWPPPVRRGRCGDAPAITQTVFAAVHLRNRHRPTHRRIVRLLRSSFEPTRRR
jgi:LysR family transcriptional regulator, flagellar master operon regulator